MKTENGPRIETKQAAKHTFQADANDPDCCHICGTQHKPKSAHTPGPWTISPNPKLITNDRGNHIATVSDNREEIKANARLIAAAPTILESLRMLVMAVGTEHQERALAEAVKAIESAEGK